MALKNELMTRIRAGGKGGVSIVRIACHELESFYLGDLKAVEQGLGLAGLSRQQDGRKYRQPDVLVNASQELKRLTRGGYQKMAGSRAIAPHLMLDGANRSHSFKVLLGGIRSLTEVLHGMQRV